METNNNAINLSRKSPRRNKPMAKVEVESITSQCLPNGWFVNPGKAMVMVYEDQIPEIEALTRNAEDEDLLERAKREFELRLQKYAEDECGGDLDKAKDICPLSVESVFLSMNQGRGMPHVKPLLSMKVVEKGLPPPQKQDTWDAQSQTADVVANVFARVLSSDDFILRIAEKVADIVGGQKSRKGN